MVCIFLLDLQGRLSEDVRVEWSTDEKINTPDRIINISSNTPRDRLRLPLPKAARRVIVRASHTPDGRKKPTFPCPRRRSRMS